MCLAQNFWNGPISAKSPIYSPWFFQILTYLGPKAINDLSIPFDRAIKELKNACFSFEIGHSRLKL